MCILAGVTVILTYPAMCKAVCSKWSCWLYHQTDKPFVGLSFEISSKINDENGTQLLIIHVFCRWSEILWVVSMSLFAYISGFMRINDFLLSRVRSELGQQPADPLSSLVPWPGHWTGKPGDRLRCSHCCCFTTAMCSPAVSLPFSCVVVRFRVSRAAVDCGCSLLISAGTHTELPLLMCQL